MEIQQHRLLEHIVDECASATSIESVTSRVIHRCCSCFQRSKKTTYLEPRRHQLLAKNCSRIRSVTLCKAGLRITNVLADSIVVQRAFQSASLSLVVISKPTNIRRRKGSQHGSHIVYCIARARTADSTFLKKSLKRASLRVTRRCAAAEQ
jgi:phosphoenolpyruvate carboxylase